MAVNKELKDQYLAYMRYREMQFQTEYIFSTCSRIRKRPVRRWEKEIIYQGQITEHKGLFSS